MESNFNATANSPDSPTLSSNPDSNRVSPASVGVSDSTNANSNTNSDSPSPLAFPESGYIGVLAEIADAYSQRYESPKEFVYLDLLTQVGLVLSGRLSVDLGEITVQPRLFTLKVAKSGWMRKSSSTSFAQRTIDRAVKLAESKVNAATLTAALATDPLASIPATTRPWMQTINGVGSAEGLANAFQKSPRILLTFDEFRRLEKKANADGSVLTYMLNELYERNKYSNHTKTAALDVTNGHLVLLSNTTEEVYLSLQNSTEMGDVGFLNRLFLIYSDKLVRRPRPKKIPDDILDPLVEQLADLLAALPPLDENGVASNEIRLSFTPDAGAIWDKFYLEMEQSPLTTRLDSLGPRLMGLFAFASGKSVIDVEIVRATIDVIEYQRRVRETLQPDTAMTPEAKVENLILRQLKKRGELTERDLKRYSNCGRYGSQACKRAITNLSDAKEIVASFVPSDAKLPTGEKRRVWRLN